MDTGTSINAKQYEYGDMEILKKTTSMDSPWIRLLNDSLQYTQRTIRNQSFSLI